MDNHQRLKIALILFLFVTGFLLYIPVHAAPDAKAAELPWRTGDAILDYWTIEEIKQHPEFIRIFLKKGREEIAVEVTFSKDRQDAWSTKHYHVQSAPGRDVPERILKEFQVRLSDWENDPRHSRIVAEAARDISKPGEDDIPRQKERKTAWPLFFLCLLVLGIPAIILTDWLIKGKIGPGSFMKPFRRIIVACLSPVSSFLFRLSKILNFGIRENDSRRPSDKISLSFFIAAGLAIAVFFIVIPANLDAPANPDYIRDLMMAKNNLTGPEFHFGGPGSTFKNISQGGGYNHFLAACLWLGLSLVEIQYLSTILFALAIWMLFLMATRESLAEIGYLAVGTGFYCGVSFGDLPTIHPNAIMHLPILLFFYFLMKLVRTGSLRNVIFAGLFLAFCTDLHLICFMLAPAYFIAAGMSCRNPISGAIMAAIVLFGCLGLGSYESHSENLKTFWESGLLILMALGLAVSLILGISFRERFRNSEKPDLNSHVINYVTFYFLLAICMVSILTGHQVKDYYFQPIFPGLAIISARAIFKGIETLSERLFDSGKHLFIPHIICAFLLLNPPYEGMHEEPEPWSVTEIQHIADFFKGEGYTFSHILQHLQTPLYRDLLFSMNFFKPFGGNGEAKTLPQKDFLVLRAPESRISEFPREYRILQLNGKNAALIRPIDSWLNRRKMTACFNSVDDAGLMNFCEDAGIDPSQIVIHSPHDVRYRRGETLSPLGGRKMEDFEGKVKFSYFIEVDIVGDDTERYIAIMNEHKNYGIEYEDDPRSWMIERVSGVEYEGVLPSNRVKIRNSGPRKGSIVFSRLFLIRSSVRGNPFPPGFVEIRESEIALKKFIDGKFPEFHRK